MLTVGQTLALFAGRESDVVSSVGLGNRNGPNPVSIRDVRDAFQNQQRACFVTLFDLAEMLAYETIEEFCATASKAGQLSQPRLSALSSYLGQHDVFLRYVSQTKPRAALIGRTESLASVPCTLITGDNYAAAREAVAERIAATTGLGTSDPTALHAEDAPPEGTAEVAGGLIGIGAIFLAVGALPEPAAPVFLIVGAGLTGLGSGALIMTGILKMTDSDPPPPIKPEPTSDNSGGDDPADTIPPAETIGDPDSGIDAEALLADLGAYTLDEIIETFPADWDSDTGAPVGPLPGPDGSGDGSTGDPTGGEWVV